MENKIYYSVFTEKGSNTRVITLYYDNRLLAELNCYNDLLGDWEEIDLFLEEECLYDVYGEDVEFIKF